MQQIPDPQIRKKEDELQGVSRELVTVREAAAKKDTENQALLRSKQIMTRAKDELMDVNRELKEVCRV